MRETIATLEVIVSDGVSDPMAKFSTALWVDPNKKGHYTITLRPNTDKPLLELINEPLNLANLETLLAHELGHFVAQVFKDPTQDKRYRMLSLMLNDSSINTPAEAKAWDIGHSVKPDLNRKIEKFALEGYSSNGANVRRLHTRGKNNASLTRT